MSFVAIASQTVTGSTSNITFSGIPSTLNGQNLRDLVLVCRNVTSGVLGVRLNNDNTASAYSEIRFSTNGSAASAGFRSNTYFSPAFQCDAGPNFQLVINLFDFTQTNKNKVMLASSNNAGSGSERFCARWANNAAVTSVSIFDVGGTNLVVGGTYALYGVAA